MLSLASNHSLENVPFFLGNCDFTVIHHIASLCVSIFHRYTSAILPGTYVMKLHAYAKRVKLTLQQHNPTLIILMIFFKSCRCFWTSLMLQKDCVVMVNICLIKKILIFCWRFCPVESAPSRNTTSPINC